MKTLKKLSIVLALILASSTLLIGLAGCVSRDRTIKILTWENYISEDVLEDFEEYFSNQNGGKKVKVVVETFETNEEAYIKINSGADYDVFVPSEYTVQRLIQNNLVKELNHSKLPNLGNVLEIEEGRKIDHIPGNHNNKYAVAYKYGTAGILYNHDEVLRLSSNKALNEDGIPQVVTSWGALWNTDFKGNVWALESEREMFGIVSLYANNNTINSEVAAGANRAECIQHYYNDASLANINRVGQALHTFHQSMSPKYGIDQITSEMMANNGAIAVTWSGEALYAMSQNNKLNYYIPNEGSNFWFDAWVIPKNAKNVDAAHMWINFMLDPENALLNMEETGYTVAIDIDVLLDAGMDPDWLEDEIQFAHLTEEFKNYAYMTNFTDAQNSQLVNMWNRKNPSTWQPLT